MAGSYLSGTGGENKVDVYSLSAGDQLTVFGQESVSSKSCVLVVNEMQKVLLSAFGLAGENKITVWKVLLDHQLGPDGDGCTDKIDIAPVASIVAEQPVCCGQWFLDECQDTVILVTKGVYRFVLEDVNTLGDVILNASLVINPQIEATGLILENKTPVSNTTTPAPVVNITVPVPEVTVTCTDGQQACNGIEYDGINFPDCAGEIIFDGVEFPTCP